jgi:hypothetical protein
MNAGQAAEAHREHRKQEASLDQFAADELRRRATGTGVSPSRLRSLEKWAQA